MLEDPLAGLEAEVEAIEARVALLQLVDHPQALQVVLETAVGAHALVERILAGMAERRVTQVMRQRNGLDQVFIQTQGAGDRAAELRDFQRMRQPCAEQIALVVQKNLGFVDQPSKGC